MPFRTCVSSSRSLCLCIVQSLSVFSCRSVAVSFRVWDHLRASLHASLLSPSLSSPPFSPSLCNRPPLSVPLRNRPLLSFPLRPSLLPSPFLSSLSLSVSACGLTTVSLAFDASQHDLSNAQASAQVSTKRCHFMFCTCMVADHRL